MAKLVKLADTADKKSSIALADAIRSKIAELAVLMDEANDRGLVVSFNININPATGKNVAAVVVQRITTL